MRKSPASDRLFVVLVGARNPLNIGAAARAMTNFGITNLRLVNPYPLAFREAKSAVGASAVLKRAQEYKTISDAVADCSLVVASSPILKQLLSGMFIRH
jgi:tRNA C32,U32 (ribose-2'-O)-methylase TrmJ